MSLFVTNRIIARKSSIGELYVCAGGIDILRFCKSSTDFSVSHFTLELCDWLPIAVYFENCITKPCEVAHRPFGCSAVITKPYVDGNCVEQFYSVQALASCTTISINALFNKSFNCKSYLNILFTLALGFQAKVLVQGRRNSGREGEVNELRAMQTCKKQKSLPIMLVFVQQQCCLQN